MTQYLIDCVAAEHHHSHIVSARVRKWTGTTYEDASTMTVAAVRSKIAEGDLFQTYSPTAKKFAKGSKDTCHAHGCTVATVRSEADAVADNNLDNMVCA
jgi:hypothetical protein